MPYIVIEGVDYSGKTTLASALKTQLKLQYGVESVLTEEPSTHNERCTEIRRLVTTDKTLTNEQLAALFLEQRILVMQDLVIPALKAGKLVIGSRSFISTMVYQSPENGYGMHGIMNSNLDALEAFGDDVIPDLGILCEITHETFLKRCGPRGEVDVLENRLRDPQAFATRCEKFLKALMYTKTALKKFDGVTYTNNFETLLTEIARKFKYELLPVDGEVSSLVPPTTPAANQEGTNLVA